MFRKLISNLPFNPSLLGTVSFYAERIKREESLRRFGFLFMALAMFIQIFAVMAPPEKSLAADSNNIINGVRTRDDILRAWDGQTGDKNVAAIYSRFGITREDIAALPMNPNVTIKTNTTDYWSMGRNSLSANSRSGQIKQQYKNNEIPVNYAGGTVYLRQLRAWNISNSVNSYKAFQGTKNGKKFWILVDCGNLTFAEKPSLGTPHLEFRKTIVGGPKSMEPGETITYKFEYRNPVPDSYPVENAVMYDGLDLAKFDIVYPTKDLYVKDNQLILLIGRVPYTSSFKTALTLKVKIKDNLPNGTQICNAAVMRAAGVPDAWSGGSDLCVTTISPCPLDASISQSDPRCTDPVLACTVTNTDVNRTTKSFKLNTVVTSSNKELTSVQGYIYDFGDGASVETKKTSSYEDTISHTYNDGSYSATVVVDYKTGKGAAQTDKTVACSSRIDSQPDSPLGQEKQARNLTQNKDEISTLTTVAKANDTIEYSLITANTYGYDRTNVNVSDYIGDILDYSDLDKSFLSSQGGTYDETTQTLSWTNQTAKANSELINKFRVKVKPAVPATNQPNTLTSSFDCQMSNKFGLQVDIKVDCPVAKTTEVVNQSLPKTGPGESLIIGFALTSIIAYFFARSRLISKELQIIKSDFANTGGI